MEPELKPEQKEEEVVAERPLPFGPSGTSPRAMW